MTKQNVSDGIERIQYDSREEWLMNRGGIGGSDAASIVGLNKYKTNQQLWKEKAGLEEPEDISDKPYIQYGHAAEPLIRSLFALEFPQYRVDYFDNNMFRNSKYPWAHASLDGELTDPDGRKGIWEGKTTTILRPGQSDLWKERIPDNYYIQCLHYLMVTGYEYVWLTALLRYEFGDEKMLQIRNYSFERKEVLEDIDYLQKEEEKFWKSLQTKKMPGLILPEF